MHLSHNKQRGGRVGCNQVAGIDQAETDAAIDGRQNVTVSHLHLVILHGAFVVLHRALVLEHDLFLVFERLSRDRILSPGVLIARLVHLRLGKQALVAIERPLRLLELRLIGPVVDIDERVAFVYELAFTIVNRSDHTSDLCRDVVCISRRHRADGVEIDADAAFGGSRQGDRYRSGHCTTVAARCRSRRARTVLFVDPEEQQPERQQDNQPVSRGGGAFSPNMWVQNQR